MSQATFYMLMAVGQLNRKEIMKIAIGIKDKESKEINEMFARSPLFQILEIEDKKIASEEFADNNFSSQTSGAGTAVVEQLAKLQIDSIICANLGPKAMDLCKQLQIKAYKTDLKGSQEAVEQLINNNLSEIN